MSLRKKIKDHSQAKQPANQGEATKRAEYWKNYNISPNQNATILLPTITTHGAPSKDMEKLVNMIYENEPEENKKFKKQQFFERLSSSIQTTKSLQIQNTIKYHSSLQQPHLIPAFSDIPSPFPARNINSSSNTQLSDLTQTSDDEFNPDPTIQRQRFYTIASSNRLSHDSYRGRQTLQT